MATPQPALQPSDGARATLDFVTRSGAALIALVYGAGFLVVGIHNALYGISVIGLLRARLITSGILFIMFAGFPLLEGLRNYGFLPQSTAQPASQLAPRIVLLLKFCRMYVGLSTSWIWAVFTAVFFRGGILAKGYFAIVSFVVTCGILAGYFAAVTMAVEESAEKRPSACIVLLCVSMAVGGAAMYFVSDALFTTRVLWFFVLGSFAFDARDAVRSPSAFKNLNWHKWLLGIVAIISFYATSMYPHMVPSFGGGAPNRVVMRLTSPLDNSQTVNAWIIDETEQGYFIVRSLDEKKAIFMPRSTVSAIYFDPAANQH